MWPDFVRRRTFCLRPKKGKVNVNEEVYLVPVWWNGWNLEEGQGNRWNTDPQIKRIADAVRAGNAGGSCPNLTSETGPLHDHTGGW